MGIVRILLRPALLMIIVAGLYVLARVQSGNRIHVFVVFALTAVGAAELFSGAMRLIKRDRATQVVPELLGGIGALLAGYATMAAQTIPFAIGILVLAGSLLWSLREIPQ